MPPKRDQENRPTSAPNTLDSDALSPPKAAARKSARNSGGKVAQLDEVPPNEADRTTVPAKRRARTKLSKEADKEASPDASGDQPPTKSSALKVRSKPAANNVTTAASKGTPSTTASVTQSSDASTKRRTNTNNVAPPPKTTPRGDATSARPNGGHGHRAPGNGGGSVGVAKGASKSVGTTAMKTQKDADGPASADRSGGASTTDPDVQRELESLRAQLARVKKKNKKASEASTTKKSKTKPQPQSLIPRPSGTLGKDWHLQAAMGLSHDKPLYSKILSDVRKLVIKALDSSKGIRKQDPVKLGAIYEVARSKRPLLTRFENDWATAQIIIQYLSNMRKQQSSSESENEDDNAKRGRKRSSDANGRQEERQRAGKRTHHQSLETEGRLHAARAVLGGEVETADDPSGDEVENEMAVDQSCNEDEDEDEDEDEGEGVHASGRRQASSDEDGNGDGEDEEDEDEGLKVPPAKRRQVAQVLPEDE